MYRVMPCVLSGNRSVTETGSSWILDRTEENPETTKKHRNPERPPTAV